MSTEPENDPQPRGELAELISSQAKSLRDTADQIECAAYGDLPPLLAARALVKLADANAELCDLVDSLNDVANVAG